MKLNLDRPKLPDADMLDHTLMMRMAIMDAVSSKESVGEEDLRILMMAADGVDRTVLAKKKLAIDEEANKSNGELNSVIAEFLLNSKPEITPSQRRSEPPTLPEEHSKIDIVPGEDSIGTIVI
jgi:hypothetical protein